MNKHIIYQVDAFTKQAFKGNPAGVMILSEKIEVEFMQNIALEMNLSETAFVFPEKEFFEIRYFTPTKEIPLCGHATLASAHIIYELGLKKLDENILFKAEGGNLNISNTEAGITMTFPKYNLKKIKNPIKFKSIVGFEPLEVYESDYDWKIAIARNESEVQNAIPIFESMIQNDLGHLMITSESNESDIDFVVRCFAPISGINEDPVTGSAQCALVPLWSLKTGKTTFKAKQISKRSGNLNVRLSNNKVEITGNAITIFKAELNL